MISSSLELWLLKRLGGPTIDFVPGRQDSSVCPREG
ncbi:unnamed protein product [Musa acuminata subsp. malaccensis]|uniref:(wild Malaysian banana) hypothetical protein n=1 Tax=Musa acuminata subsp. malaccensis TaxID=214687 RepID=A0A804HPM6_MUSAM|nr:unnamed protein product [Musa acuminata subsp. malaccensis]